MSQSIDDTWLGQSHHGNGDGVRVRSMPPLAAWISSAPDHIAITWTCGWRDRLCYGGPGTLTEARMEAFEKGLTTLVEARGIGRLMAVVGKGINRTWHFYASDAGQVLKLVEQAINDGKTGSLSIEVRVDPQWATWEQLKASIAAPTVLSAPGPASIAGCDDAGTGTPAPRNFRGRDEFASMR